MSYVLRRIVCCFLRFSTHNISYIIFSENKELEATDQIGTSTVTIAYISFGVGFISIVMCFVFAFCFYRKSGRKRMERLHLIIEFYHNMGQTRARIELNVRTKHEPRSGLDIFLPDVPRIFFNATDYHSSIRKSPVSRSILHRIKQKKQHFPDM